MLLVTKIVQLPSLPEVADSAAFMNKPSLGVTIHQKSNEDGEQWVELNTWKVRNTRLYKIATGSVSVTFDPARQSYRERWH